MPILRISNTNSNFEENIAVGGIDAGDFSTLK